LQHCKGTRPGDPARQKDLPSAIIAEAGSPARQDTEVEAFTTSIARVLDLFARMTPVDALQTGKADLVARMTREQVAG